MAKTQDEERRQDREGEGRKAGATGTGQSMARPEQSRTGRAATPARREDPGPGRPWSLRQMFDEFDRMFEDMQLQLLGSPLGGRPWGLATAWAPHMDVEDREQELVLTVELPGFDPDEVSVDCTENVLTIRGEHRESHEEGGYRAERSFHRQIAVPSGCDLEKIQATFRSGLLRIRLPRTEQRGRRIPISTEEKPGRLGGEQAA